MISSAILALALVNPKAPQRSAGDLVSLRPDGKPGVVCALKGTSVQADIDGFGAAVTVTQTFTNPSKTPIEAIYTFPLPADAAVDRMRIQVGTRIIEGEIAKREDARRTYEAAKAAGQAAALLDQERPNIFTQAVANIMPGAEIKVQIRYVQILPYSEGQYEFNFPMTVAPRYVDGNTPDPDKITPPITPQGTRTGASIDLTVNLDAGAVVRELTSGLHAIDRRQIDDRRMQITLAKRNEIPNRDFILRYRVAQNTVQTGVVSHFVPGQGGTFALSLMPPKAVAPAQVQAKEMIFVMDQSGSQNGFPIEKSKELTLRFLKRMGPRDTFNVIGFSNDVNPLWPEAQPNTPANVATASKFVAGLDANGGTQLEKAIVASMAPPDDPERLRMVVFNTDGMAGQEAVILDEIRKHRGDSRLFAFGIGNSVNRYLIEAMATEGRGDMEVVTLADQADGAADRLFRRANSPVLTNLSAEAGGALDITPAHLPDVFLERPVVLMGRYSRPGPTQITVHGTTGDGTPWSRVIDVNLSGAAEAPALPSLWARRRIDDLVREATYRTRSSEGAPSAEGPVTELALAYRIMSPYTSFVAVEKRVINVGGKSRTVRVPVEMADGVSYDKTTTRHLGSYAQSSYGVVKPLGKANLPVAAAPAGPGGRPSSVSAGFGGATAAETVAGTRLRSIADGPSAEAPENRYARKVAEELRKATGTVAIQILLTKWDPKTMKALAELGLKIEEKDQALKVLFGTVDAKKLKALAQLEGVAKITALE
ncbi:MAG: VIT domain-containing protein [Fimbriimonas sp.]